MDMIDKRILNKKQLSEQEDYLESIVKKTPDASDKYEELDMNYEPINLLQRIKAKKKEVDLQQETSAEQPEED